MWMRQSAAESAIDTGTTRAPLYSLLGQILYPTDDDGQFSNAETSPADILSTSAARWWIRKTLISCTLQKNVQTKLKKTDHN